MECQTPFHKIVWGQSEQELFDCKKEVKKSSRRGKMRSPTHGFVVKKEKLEILVFPFQYYIGAALFLA